MTSIEQHDESMSEPRDSRAQDGDPSEQEKAMSNGKRLAMVEADVGWVVEFFDGVQSQVFKCATEKMAQKLVSVLERMHCIRVAV